MALPRKSGFRAAPDGAARMAAAAANSSAAPEREEAAAAAASDESDGGGGGGLPAGVGDGRGGEHRGAKYAPVFDRRNRRVPHLQIRGGVYYAQLWTEGTDGRKTARRFRLTTEAGRPVESLVEAKEAVERLKHERRENRLPQAGHKPLLDAYVETYLASGAFQAKKAGTRDLEQLVLERFVRHLGAVRVDRITTAHVAGYVDLRLKGEVASGARTLRPVSERTVQLDLVILRNVLKAAVDAGHLREVPRFPRLRVPPPLKKTSVSPADVERLLQLCESACERNGAQLRDYLRFLAYTGAREKEALKVRWSDVDFTVGAVTIGADGDTKNRRARSVEFNPALRAHLVDMKARRVPDSVYLFPSPRRAALDDDRPARTFRESVRLLRAAAGLPSFGFHDLRRFFATMCIQSGADVQTVARWLGHQDGGILVAKTYADVLGDHRRRVAEGLRFS